MLVVIAAAAAAAAVVVVVFRSRNPKSAVRIRQVHHVAASIRKSWH
jgi:hypothetical protein